MFDFLKAKLPSAEWLNDRSEVPLHTPDLFRLERSKQHLMFEYGELAVSSPIQRKLISTLPVCPAFTVERLTLWVKEDRPVSLRFTLPNLSIPRAPVQGFIFALSAQEIMKLDNYRENGVLYNRKRTKLVVPYTNADGDLDSLHAWMYTGNKEHWHPLIDWDQNFYRNGDCTFHVASIKKDNRPWLKQYYHYEQSDRK